MRLQNRSLRPIAALSEVIEKPAARFGIRLENGLTGRMVEETRGADALPLLAYTLRELYEKYGGDDLLTVAEYEQLGGVEGAIERKLTEALSDPSPTPEELAAFRRSFVRQLVRVDENAVEGERYLRTAARRDSLPQEADRLIGRLQNARLLIAGDDGTISIAHERLIRNWSNVPLQAWLAEDGHDRKLIDSLKSFLAAYKEGGPLLSQKPLADGRDFLEREPSLGDDEPELAQFIRSFPRRSRRPRAPAATAPDRGRCRGRHFSGRRVWRHLVLPRSAAADGRGRVRDAGCGRRENLGARPTSRARHRSAGERDPVGCTDRELGRIPAAAGRQGPDRCDRRGRLLSARGPCAHWPQGTGRVGRDLIGRPADSDERQGQDRTALGRRDAQTAADLRSARFLRHVRRGVVVVFSRWPAGCDPRPKQGRVW